MENVNFFWGKKNTVQCFAAYAYVRLRVMLEKRKSDYRLTFDSFLDFLFPYPQGPRQKRRATTMADSFCLERGGGGGGAGVLEGFILVMVIGLLVWK